jgi:hypothetical protein
LDFLYTQFANHFQPSTEVPAPQPKAEAQVQNAVPPQTPEQAFPTAGELKTEADFQPLPF